MILFLDKFLMKIHLYFIVFYEFSARNPSITRINFPIFKPLIFNLSSLPSPTFSSSTHDQLCSLTHNTAIVTHYSLALLYTTRPPIPHHCLPLPTLEIAHCVSHADLFYMVIGETHSLCEILKFAWFFICIC